MTEKRAWKVGFNRTNERDYVPCVREWDDSDGRHTMMVVRTSSSGRCYRSIVIRSGGRDGRMLGAYHSVTEPGDSVRASDIWKDLARSADVKLPTATDPTIHISMATGPTRSM